MAPAPVTNQTDGTLIFRSGARPLFDRPGREEHEQAKRQKTQNGGGQRRDEEPVYHPEGTCPNCGGDHVLKRCPSKWQSWLRIAARAFSSDGGARGSGNGNREQLALRGGGNGNREQLALGNREQLALGNGDQGNGDQGNGNGNGRGRGGKGKGRGYGPRAGR